MDAAGGVPILRGHDRRPSARSRELAWWERRHAARRRRRAGAGRLADARGRVPARDVATPRARATTSSRDARVPCRSANRWSSSAPPACRWSDSVAVEGHDPRAMLGREPRGRANGSAGPSPSSSTPRASPTRPTSAAWSSASGTRTELDARPSARCRAGRDQSPTASSLQPMLEAGVELIVGARRDPQFGPLLAGRGSAASSPRCSTTSPSAWRPVGRNDAREMLDELRGARLLDGVARPPRSSTAAPVGALIVALGQADRWRNRSWLEVDLNPVIAGPTGAARRRRPDRDRGPSQIRPGTTKTLAAAREPDHTAADPAAPQSTIDRRSPA